MSDARSTHPPALAGPARQGCRNGIRAVIDVQDFHRVMRTALMSKVGPARGVCLIRSSRRQHRLTAANE